jgi:hypothetical protein
MFIPLAIFVGVFGLLWVAAGTAGKARVLPREALAMLSANPTPGELREFARVAKGSGFAAISALAETIADLKEGRKDPHALQAVQPPPAWVVARIERLRVNPFALDSQELTGLENWFRQSGFIAQADTLRHLRNAIEGGWVVSIVAGLWGLVFGAAALAAPVGPLIGPSPPRGSAEWYRYMRAPSFLILLIPPSFFSQRESPEA